MRDVRRGSNACGSDFPSHRDPPLPASPSDVAKQLFRALDEARWTDAAALASKRFVEENAKHFAFRLRGLRERHPTEADLEIPDDPLGQFALWLEKSDVRAESERALADARRESPDVEFVVVGGAGIRQRFPVGELRESDDRAIVVYRQGSSTGSPRTLELEREEGEWRFCSEDFSFEGTVGLGVARSDMGE